MAKEKMSAGENIKVIVQLLKYIKRYIPIFVLSTLFALISSVLTLYIPVLIGDSVDLIVDKNNVDFDGIFHNIEIMGILIIVTALCQWLMNVCNNKMTGCIVRDIRHDAFSRLQRMPLSYIDSQSHGDIVSRVISDVDSFADGLLMGFSQFFTGVVIILGTLIFMLRINIKISIIIVVMTPISMFVASFIASKIHRYFVAQTEIKGRVTSYIDEMTGGIRVVKAFNHEDKTIKEFKEINDELNGVALKAVFYSSLVNPSTRFVNNIIYAVVAFVGAVGVIAGNITVGNLTCLLSYANQYTKPFNEISGVVTELQNALCCAARIFELINKPEEEDGDSIIDNIDGRIEIRNVDFSYSEDNPLITNLNLSVKPGMRVAIVGPTGCGKTTIINLLMRFYKVNGGMITVDDTDISKAKVSSLRNNYGMVLQDTFLFHGTIRENISMAKKDATMEEIVAAAKASYADGFIRRLPNGYDTYIGDDLGGLSEGQKQLLCISRVMLLLPPMLILDEATSSIDTRTEMKIQSAFAKMMKGRTCFIVAHRLSTIREADVILVMDKGHIIEQGNHEELLEKRGFYYNLYTGQTGE